MTQELHRIKVANSKVAAPGNSSSFNKHSQSFKCKNVLNLPATRSLINTCLTAGLVNFGMLNVMHKLAVVCWGYISAPCLLPVWQTNKHMQNTEPISFLMFALHTSWRQMVSTHFHQNERKRRELVVIMHRGSICHLCRGYVIGSGKETPYLVVSRWFWTFQIHFHHWWCPCPHRLLKPQHVESVNVSVVSGAAWRRLMSCNQVKGYHHLFTFPVIRVAHSVISVFNSMLLFYNLSRGSAQACGDRYSNEGS